jgi:hypothetical protein
MRNLLLIPILILCLELPLYAAEPVSVHAHYILLKDSFRVGTMDETFTRKHDHYTIDSASRAIGLLALFKPEVIHVTSEGVITAGGLRPSTFITARKIDTDRNARADFDWKDKRITLIDRKGKRTLPLPDGTQDRLSAMYQFMFLALNDAKKLDFHMTNGSKVDIYNYTLTAGKSVTTPLGTFSAIYAASPIEPGNSRTEIWLATGHHNFPCKMVITDPDGGKIIQELTKLDFAP